MKKLILILFLLPYMVYSQSTNLYQRNKEIMDSIRLAFDSIGVVHSGFSGGTINQVLRKASNTDYDYTWGTLAGGGDLLAANNLSDLANAGTALNNLGGTTIGKNLFGLSNPGAIRFPRFNADNTITSRTAAEILSDIGGQASLGYTPLNPANNLSDVTASTARTNLGLVIGTNIQAYDADLSIYAGITPSSNIQSYLGAADYAAMKTLLSLTIGTNVQAYDADLDIYAGITPSSNVQSLLAAANYAAINTLLSINNVTNTSDANKPVSTAQQAALDLKGNIISQTFVTPNIGVATGTSLAATGSVTSSGTAGIGYATGAGGTVTQSTSKSTGVTLNKISGQITMNGAALAAAAEVAFTLTNSTIAATDVVVVCVQSVGTAGSYLLTVGAVAAGSCSITVSNASAGSLSQAIVLNFVVIKGVSN